MWRGLSEFEKRRIAAALPLQKGIALQDVLAKVESAMAQFWHAMNAYSEWRHKDIEVSENEIRLRFRAYPIRGRPRKDEMRSYVTTLIVIYEHATGRRIGRNVDAYALGHREKPHPFLLACIRPMNSAYPRRIIRDVIGARK